MWRVWRALHMCVVCNALRMCTPCTNLSSRTNPTAHHPKPPVWSAGRVSWPGLMARAPAPARSQDHTGTREGCGRRLPVATGVATVRRPTPFGGGSGYQRGNGPESLVAAVGHGPTSFQPSSKRCGRLSSLLGGIHRRSSRSKLQRLRSRVAPRWGSHAGRGSYRIPLRDSSIRAFPAWVPNLEADVTPPRPSRSSAS